MEWLKRFMLVGLMLLIRLSIGLEQLPAEPDLGEKPKEDILLKAIMFVESRYNPMAVNHKEDAVGILQIRPIAIREANRILILQGRDHRFTLNDRADSLKSVQVWYVIQGYHNPDYDPLRAARIWNGRNMPQTYWMDIENELRKNEATCN